jgi:glycosyltransferase involved in cell wall biosynthesis
MLERFYTDVCGNVGWGRSLAALAKLPGASSTLRKLAHRRVPSQIAAKTETFAGPNLRWEFGKLLSPAASPDERLRRDIIRNLEMGKAAAAGGFGDVTHLYVMFTEFTSLLDLAKRAGLKVVSEIYILLQAERILKEEQTRFPEWEMAGVDSVGVLKEFHLESVIPEWADHFICPSQAVADDLVDNWGAQQEAVSIVPYGMSPSWLKLEPQPQRGRVFFAGSAILRKGIHYLAMASEELVRRGRKYEFRIAGHADERVRNHPRCQHLQFLGRVPRARIQEEFQQADVFVLPSLAEGSAEVTYEALASGLPLITTKASGSVATDGQEGRIVPERDPEALADAIESTVENRTLRNEMAAAARATAANYTWDKYGERLARVLTKI